MRKLIISLVLPIMLSVILWPCSARSGDSPFDDTHIKLIQSLFKENGLKGATASIDRYGRVQLGGNYKDSREVSLAFSIAQSVVGVKWTSPVTPENVKVREWAEKLTMLFPTKKKESAISGEVHNGDGISNKYAVVVGVSRFKNDKGGKNSLKYAAKDAQDVYDYLVDPKYGHFLKENVVILVNEDATIPKIQQSLDNVKDRADSDDEVLVYFSSHGAPVYDGSLNIVTYETVFKNHFTMGDSSFPSKSLKSFLGETRARTIIMILDVCYSGAAFKGIDGFYHAGSKSISFDEDNQGLSGNVMKKVLLGSKDIVLEDEPANQVQAKSSEAIKVLISASDAGEKSWESDSLKASFFTHHFLGELRKQPDLKTAFEITKPKVKDEVRKVKEADQNPQAIVSRKDWDGIVKTH